MYRYYWIVWVLICWPLVCVGQRVTVSSWQELAPYLEEIDSSGWVIFDVDLVLIQPQASAFQMAHCGHYPQLIPEILATLPQTQWPLFWNFISLSLEHMLVDSSIPRLLSSLNRRGVPYFAITDTLTGSFAEFPSVEIRKRQLLIDLGIHFYPPYSEPTHFSEYPTYRGQYPCFWEGILFTNGESSRKGPLLKTYLAYAQMTPRKLIVIDDLAHNLDSIERTFTQEPQPSELLLIHFLTTTHLDPKPMSEASVRSQWEEIRDRAASWF